MISRIWRHAFVLLISAVTFTSCDKNVLMDEHIALPDNRWSSTNSLKLEAVIADTAESYDVYINVRNSAGYAFSNLFLFINTYTPDGKLARDTMELELADERGQWKGDGLGDIWDNRILFKKGQRFPVPGTYRFELEQAMRVEPLPGIMDAGLRIERSKKD
ncbi:MAG: gliding motility lipoprotein GldH [Bacteroidota bacterium]